MVRPKIPKLDDLPELPTPPEIGSSPPHRMIDSIADLIPRTARSIISTVGSVFDKLPLGRKGPHSAVEDIANGVLGGVEQVGEGVAKAFDTPVELAQNLPDEITLPGGK